METFLKRDIRSVIFVVALATMGASIAYLLIADTNNGTFWGMSINAFACLCTTISVGIGISKQRKEEQEQER